MIAVVPLVGAWIETCNKPSFVPDHAFVAPFAGAWIETTLFANAMKLKKSLPSRERGLNMYDIINIVSAQADMDRF